MEKKIYRNKLGKALKTFGLTDGTIGVYLAGTRNKKPHGDIRHAISKMKGVKHPYDCWGYALKDFFAQMN